MLVGWLVGSSRLQLLAGLPGYLGMKEWKRKWKLQGLGYIGLGAK